MDGNIIFYSNKCVHCKKIIDLITNENIMERFKLICIDNQSKSYPYIHRVPTLLISKDHAPLVGVNAFNYIKANTQFNKGTNNINLNPNKNISQDLNILLSNKGPQITSNFKVQNNNFSFIEEKNDESLIDQFKPNLDKIHIIPEVDKINSKNQKNKLNQLMNLRNKQNIGLNDSDKMSSDTGNILNSHDINSKYNELKFGILEDRKVNITPNVDFIGKSTSKIRVEKK